jgi:hypothetical protein
MSPGHSVDAAIRRDAQHGMAATIRDVNIPGVIRDRRAGIGQRHFRGLRPFKSWQPIIPPRAPAIAGDGADHAIGTREVNECVSGRDTQAAKSIFHSTVCGKRQRNLVDAFSREKILERNPTPALKAVDRADSGKKVIRVENRDCVVRWIGND